MNKIDISSEQNSTSNRNLFLRSSMSKKKWRKCLQLSKRIITRRQRVLIIGESRIMRRRAIPITNTCPILSWHLQLIALTKRKWLGLPTQWILTLKLTIKFYISRSSKTIATTCQTFFPRQESWVQMSIGKLRTQKWSQCKFYRVIRHSRQEEVVSIRKASCLQEIRLSTKDFTTTSNIKRSYSRCSHQIC